MSATQDYVALDWIKGDVSQTLDQAQYALESFAESPDNAGSMRSCLTALHQVHGTMKMVELLGPTQVASEMENLAQALMNNNVPDTSEAQEVLMQTILQMPAYLDLIQREQDDSEQNYMPLVNNLRLARGEERIGAVEESADLLGPNLDPVIQAPSEDTIAHYIAANGEVTLPKLRQRYQQSIAALIKKTKARENLSLMGKVFTMLIKLSGESPIGNLARLGLALVEGIATGAIKLTAPVVNQMRGIDAEMARLAAGGSAALSDPISRKLVLGILDVINSASKDTAKIVIARSIFAPNQATGSDQADQVTIGPDDETLAAVSKILIEEVRTITDKLDLYVRSSERKIQDLVDLLPAMEQIASTLMVVGLNQHQESVSRQVEVIKNFEQEGVDPEEDTLLDIARDLLEIESTLGAIAGDAEDGSEIDNFGDLDEAQAAVVREARKGLAQSRDSLIEFVSSDFDHSKIADLPEELAALRGALLIVNQIRSSDVLAAASRYVDVALLRNRTRPELSSMDDLADAITSIDYFLERLIENAREPYLQMLEVAEGAVEKLGFPVGEEPEPSANEEPSASEEPSADKEPSADSEPSADKEPSADSEPSAPNEPQVEPQIPITAPVADEPAMVVAGESAATSEAPALAPEHEAEDDLIDEEIIEIFVEEVEEVLETINEFLPQWQADPTNIDARTEVRRAFHTLKGSGRMVGARVLGELAWSIENMLNRLIDETIQMSSEMMTLISNVVSIVPEGMRLFREQNQDAFEVDDYVRQAEAFAAGEMPLPAAVELSPVEIEPNEIEEPDTAVTSVEETDIEGQGEIEEGVPREEIVQEEFAPEEIAPEEAVVDLSVEQPEPEDVEDSSEVSLEEFELDSLDVNPTEESIHSLDSFSDNAVVDGAIADDTDHERAPSEQTTTEQTAIEQTISEQTSDTVDEDLALDDLSLDEAISQETTASLLQNEEPAPAESAPTTEELLESDDLELDDIFVIEANERLEVIGQFLAESSDVDGDLVAAFHTLKGSAAMAEVPAISRVAAPLEQMAQQYLTQNKPVDAGFRALVQRGSELFSKVVGDLAGNRESIDGEEELVKDVEQLLGSDESASTSFDFEKIKLLSEEKVVSSNWQGDYVVAVQFELEHAKEQAEALGQEQLSRLVTSLLRIYSEVRSTPAESVIDALRTGHNRLVSMFDQIAASQDVETAQDVIQLLDAVDLQSLDPVVIEEVMEGSVGDTEEIQDDSSTDIPESAATLLPEDDIDVDILPIFMEEAEELLEAIDQSIQDWSEDSESQGNLNNLLRHLHTLKGGARMAGLNSLGELTHNFETYLIDIQQNPVVLDEGFFTRVNLRQDDITRRVEVYRKIETGGASADEVSSLQLDFPVGGQDQSNSSDRIPDGSVDGEHTGETPAISLDTAGLAAMAPDAAVDTLDLPSDEIDKDVLPIFLEETEELLEGIDQSIQAWSENTTDPTHPGNLLRHLHTLKGGARMAGMNSLGEFTHNFETYLASIEQNPVALDAAFFAFLNQRQDEITRRVGIYEKLASHEATEAELDSLTQDLPGDVSTSKAGETQPTDRPEAARDEQSSATPSSPSQSQSQEMVRVSSDLLEELISLAGESSITRGRVEQQISDFGESLQEMEETILRIREQVRRLEIEAESRETLIRSHSADGDSSYDELEMDRYTMLQEISRTLNESSSDMLDLKETLVNSSRDAETLLHQQARIGSELQEGLTRTRMVPFARLIPRLRRIVRQISSEIGKAVRFDAFNIEGELDRSVLERIVAPLEHMLRNAVDHGIESAEKRNEVGKPTQGRISLRLSREGGYVVLNVSDDGGGIDVAAVRLKAIEKGMITAETVMSDQEVMQFIMDAGFSTAQKLTQISGRGVGMDVVTSEIKSLGGSISIDSTLGVGTEFTIRIPFTVSINRALMVIVREETYAVPLNTIEGIVRVSPYELEAYYQPDAPRFEYAGQPYRLDYLGKMLDKSDAPNLTGQVAPLPVILARSGDNAVALQVDRVIGSREVVVKTLGPQFSDVGGIAGATVLGDGSVVVILDVMALVRTHDLQFTAIKEDLMEIEEVSLQPEKHVKTVMIVDDSVTVRKVTSRLMERQGWDVVTAKDGVDAVGQLQDIYPDVVLLDIEMPRMDGFEVLRTVRHDKRLKDLPIIMITSRTGEKHKQEALELGVNRYLGKPFQEASLLATIEEVLAETGNN